MFTMKNRVICEVAIRGSDLRTGQVLENVLHYYINDPALGYDVAVGTVDSTTTLTSVYASWVLNAIPNTSTHYQLVSLVMREIVGVHLIGGVPTLTFRGLETVLATPGSDRGGITGETLPPNNSYSVRKNTSLAGRHFRGGMRLSLVNESKQSNGALTASQLSALQADMNNFALSLDTGGSRPDQDFRLLVFSKTVAILGGSGTWTGAFADTTRAEVATLRVNPNVGTQQSRKARQTDLIDQAA